jgi:hypothetical protein
MFPLFVIPSASEDCAVSLLLLIPSASEESAVFLLMGLVCSTMGSKIFPEIRGYYLVIHSIIPASLRPFCPPSAV